MTSVFAHLVRHRLFYGVLLLSFLLRLPLIFTSQGHVDADAAEIGLMAKHILDKGEHTIFQWKLPYTGGYSIEAHLAVPLFYFFGASSQALKGVGLLLSLVVLAVSYHFTYKWFNRSLAILSSLLFSLATPLIQWNLQMRGGYLEAVVFTVLIFSIMFTIFREKTAGVRYYALWGFLSGLAWWNSEIILPILVTSFIVWWTFDKFFFLRFTFLFYVIFFLLGNGFTIYYNLTHNYANIHYVFGALTSHPEGTASITVMSWLNEKLKDTVELLTATLPRFFEPDNEWSYARNISVISWGQYLILLWAFAHSIRNIHWASCALDTRSSLMLYMVMHLGAYVFMNPYGPQVHRFLILLYPYIAILTADLIISLYSRKGFAKAVGSVIFILGVVAGESDYIHSLGKHSEWMDPDFTNDLGTLRLQLIHTEGRTISRVIAFLESQGIGYVHTTPYIKYRLVFESQETIIASSEYFPLYTDYNPMYENIVREAGPRPMAVVLYNKSGFRPPFERVLRDKAIPFKKRTIGEMVVYYSLSGDQLSRDIIFRKKEEDLPGEGP